jgi:hypothetical protein
MTCSLRLSTISILFFALSLSDASIAEERPVDFTRDIRPILSDKCFFCHGPDPKHREADLRLDLEDAAKDSAVVPGKPDSSDLVARITSDDPEEQMPPAKSGKSLNEKEVALLTRWIAEGAAWSKHWAYVPPSRHEVPAPKNASWSANWIDNFILTRLEQDQIAPSSDADPVALLRRLYFDLTGLPPSPEEVDRFLSDKSANAYEKLVDRLLKSERYGERMAMYWLDLVRYADTVGYHGDQDHNISPYRDYVIDAFNDNMPLDQFTREQLAGDLLPNSTVDQKIASGYNRLLQTSHEGGVQPKEYLSIYAADRVRNLSAVWFGGTLGCAQCHDHKFDPYTTKDFYSIVSFFADLDEAQHFTKGGNSLPTPRPPELKVLTKRERHEIANLDASTASLEASLKSLAATDTDRASALQAEIGAAKKHKAEIEKNARKTMISVAIKPRTIRVLPRGNWLDDSGEIVDPKVPQFLGKLDVDERRATRLDLANWLTDSQQGVGLLTARVFANRFWYLLFGVGLSKDLDDFGGQGEPPVYPHLLDNLTVEFVESGWDVKHMMKLIVMSRVYRQSSVGSPELVQKDPYNRLYARQSSFRLPAESVRDNALAISGLLVLDYGGASVKPYQPGGYYRHLNFPTRKYSHHTDDRQWRRGVYVHWQRQFLHPMLKAMDAPSREECTAERPRSNTPLAALTLLNDPTFVEAARVFAESIVRHGGADFGDRLEFAFRRAVSRSPDDFERTLLQELLANDGDRFKASPEKAKQLINIGQAPVASDLDATELAAWTSVARAILNLNETNSRN